MKNRASIFLKHVISILKTIAKVKSIAVRSKTSAIKTRLKIFGLLRNKKLLVRAISDKIHALMGQNKGGDGGGEVMDYNNAIALYDSFKNDRLTSPTSCTNPVMCADDDDYLDLANSFFDVEDEDHEFELDDGTGSVVDLVRNSREDGSEFRLEDEIDLLADMFIRKFHRQMREAAEAGLLQEVSGDVGKEYLGIRR